MKKTAEMAKRRAEALRRRGPHNNSIASKWERIARRLEKEENK